MELELCLLVASITRAAQGGDAAVGTCWAALFLHGFPQATGNVEGPMAGGADAAAPVPAVGHCLSKWAGREGENGGTLTVE